MLAFVLSDHDARRLQEESGAPATAATPAAGRTDRFADGQPQHGREGQVHHSDLGDH